MANEIKVCECDGKTPLIWTFKFPGSEYWCPKCGYTSGMFGAGKNVKSTPKLEKSLIELKEKAKEFLSGNTDDWVYSD